MKLTFGKMRIHNFLSFLDEEFDFSETRHMTLICGKNNDVKNSKNGSGKSATFSALLYCLFGELVNNIKIQNLRNRYCGSKDMFVELEFKSGDTGYHLIRGLNKYGMSYVELHRISSDGIATNLTKSSIAETNLFLENEILHCDISIFLRTTFLSSDQNYNFFRLKPQPKKEFIERLFDISIFGSMYNLIHRDILQQDKLIYSSQNNLLTLNNTEQDYKVRMDKFSEEIKKNLEQTEEKLSEVKKEYQNLKNSQIDLNETQIKNFEDLLNKLNDASIKIKAAIKKFEQQSIKLIKAKSKLESTRSSKQSILDQYDELLGKICDDCRPIVSEYYDLPKISDEIKDLDQKISRSNVESEKIQNEIQTYSEKLDKIEDKSKLINKKIYDLTSESNNLRIKLLQYENQISNLTKNLEKFRAEKNPYTDLYNKNHLTLITESKNLEEISTKTNYLKYAENIVSQDTIKKFIIKDLVQMLNVKIKYYLTRLGSNYTCIFDENMDYQFITDGGVCEYDNFSSGEKMRLMIAVSFAFKDFMSVRSNITSNILVLDEFIDSNVDTFAIENIIKILKEFSIINNQSIYIISHRKEIDNALFDNIIQIVKTNNCSKITYLPQEK